jgi:hypothetical protein
MKLIRCKSCNDIIALHAHRRLCACGKSFGYYTDELNALKFVAFVIPKQCDTFERIKREDE